MVARPIDRNAIFRLRSLLLGLLWLPLTAAGAWALDVKPGDIVTCDGVLILAQGADERQSQVVYPAIQLRRTLRVVDAAPPYPQTRLLRLRLNRQQDIAFRRLRGKQVRVSGRIHYFWFGPNTLPNPAHLEVFTIGAR